MRKYVLRRLLATVPLVLGVATLIFVLVHMAPGDPTRLLVPPNAQGAVVDQIRSNYGLDRPVHVQYLRWLGSVVTGDLGTSFSHNQPVVRVIAQALPNTLVLSACALILSFFLGIVVGTLQAVRQHSAADSALSVILLFFYSMPSFWLALMLVMALSLWPRMLWDLPLWLPVSGMVSADYSSLGPMARVLDRLWHLVLPTISLSLVLTAGVARFMRASMLEVIRQDFVRTARAKGLAERSVVFGHALRNALAPIITLGGLMIPFLFSGTVLIERVFAWPGMGRMTIDAIFQRDYPLVMGGSLLFALTVILANLIADVLYAVADPRVGYE